jgi:transposase
MNVLLHQVVRDSTGLTGMTIIRAIVAGECDPQVLAQHRDYRCRRSADEIAQSLTGNYRADHVFALTQALALSDSSQAHIALCDEQIEQYLQTFTPVTTAPCPLAHPGSTPRTTSRLMCRRPCTRSPAWT